MQRWDVGSFLVRLPREVGPVCLLGADEVNVQNRVMWRTRFKPTKLERGDTRLWEFSIDVFWEPNMEPSVLQFSTQARICLPASARRWLEGNVRIYNDHAAVRLTTTVNQDETISVYSSLMTEMSTEEVLQLSQNAPPTEAVRIFHRTYKDITGLLLQAWLDGWKLGHQYRTLN